MYVCLIHIQVNLQMRMKIETATKTAYAEQMKVNRKRKVFFQYSNGIARNHQQLYDFKYLCVLHNIFLPKTMMP